MLKFRLRRILLSVESHSTIHSFSVFQKGIITPDNIEAPVLTTKIIEMKTMIKNDTQIQTRTVHMQE